MRNETKIHLSPLEKDLIQNKKWILTKTSITNKVYQLFGEMHKIFREILEHESHPSLDNVLQKKGGKISKGENYLGLPYVIMDYPASFSKENIFAIRTFFWWGNFFSISLHLSGEKFQLKGNLNKGHSYLIENSFYICVNENEWQHEFEPSNYAEASVISEERLKHILSKGFFKVSKKLDLNNWEEAPNFFMKGFNEIIEFLKISFPAGEKVP